MTAKLIDGQAIADQIYDEIQAEVAKLKEKHNVTPGLATVLVGENPASQAYVRSKQKTCTKCGFHSIGENLAADASQEEVEAVVKRLNEDPAIHGILVQLPLPKHIDEEKVLRDCIGKIRKRTRQRKKEELLAKIKEAEAEARTGDLKKLLGEYQKLIRAK